MSLELHPETALPEIKTPARDAFHVAYVALRQLVLHAPAWQGDDGPQDQELAAMAWALRLLAERCWMWVDDSEACHHWSSVEFHMAKAREAHWASSTRLARESQEEEV